METKSLVAANTKGTKVLLLRLRTLELLRDYRRLTVRMAYYRLISADDYPNDREFYKRLQYSLKRLRKLLPEARLKLEDPTRQVSVPIPPSPDVELWVEKQSLQFVLQGLASKYHIPVLALRGFGSLSMFRKALQRAAKKKVTKILYVGDFDPSGLLIEEVAAKEMKMAKFERVAVTPEQAKKYRLPSVRVKKSDSRARKYIEKHGDEAWEAEALPPKALLHIVERAFRENLSEKFLKEISLEDEVARMTRPLERQLVGKIRAEAMELVRKGATKDSILARLKRRFEIRA